MHIVILSCSRTPHWKKPKPRNCLSILTKPAHWKNSKSQLQNYCTPQSQKLLCRRRRWVKQNETGGLIDWRHVARERWRKHHTPSHTTTVPRKARRKDGLWFLTLYGRCSLCGIRWSVSYQLEISHEILLSWVSSALQSSSALSGTVVRFLPHFSGRGPRQFDAW